MSDARLTLRIELDVGEHVDAEERDDAARALRSDLLELDVQVARPVVAAPDGARGGEAMALGTLLVSLGPNVLASVCDAVRGWMQRSGGRRVQLELDGDQIELTGVSKEDQRRLVELFVARHQGG